MTETTVIINMDVFDSERFAETVASRKLTHGISIKAAGVFHPLKKTMHEKTVVNKSRRGAFKMISHE
jgi:hypothetical protein